MKITWSRYGNKETVSIADAIEGSIGSSLSEGQVETIRDKLNDTIEVLSKLVEFLHDNKCLTNEQISSMLGYLYKIEYE